MFFLEFASLRVLVSEDEMDLDRLSTNSNTSLSLTEAYLVGGATLVGTKHDDIRRSVGEFLGV